MMNNGIRINKKTMNTDNFTALNKKMNNENWDLENQVKMKN